VFSGTRDGDTVSVVGSVAQGNQTRGNQTRGNQTRGDHVTATVTLR
jgi:hypothetical protein